MAAYYKLSTGEFVHSNDVEEDIYHLVKDKVFLEMAKRGVSGDDTYAAFQQIARELEQEYDSQ